jgi:hypothetical protein
MLRREAQAFLDADEARWRRSASMSVNFLKKNFCSVFGRESAQLKLELPGKGFE